MMKSSFGKLKKFALHKDKKDHQILLHLDGLSQASQDMKDMRDCYDSLLSAAAAAANSAYEFSESLMEMGTCLLEKIALNGDGENRKAMSMLGGVQLELQKFVDCYRSHIILTITNPSESLLSELRKVEEMKLQCDEKREVYEYMAKRGKGGKGESFTSQQLQAAREDYEEMARLCIFRVQSLKQGQCRSLLTQAARHHGAQLNFFRKGLKSLESVEPQIRMVAENQHIDYQPVELDDSEDGGKSYEANDDGELSFDYRKNKQEPNDSFPMRDSMEFDPADAPSTLTSGMEEVELDLGRNQEQVFTRQPRVVSHSAPIFAEKSDISDRIKQTQTSARKFHTYVLPTPADAKSLTSRTSVSLQHSSTMNTSGGSNNPWHSSPLSMDKYSKFSDDNLSTDTLAKGQSTAQEIKDHTFSTPLPPPLAEGTSLPQNDIQNGIDARKIRRLAFSGPLASKPSSSKPLLSASGPIGLAERPLLEPGLASGIPISQPPSTLDVSYSASPPLVSSPKISELHELPRPPGLLASKPSSSTAFGHSAPLVNRNQETSPTNQSPVLASNTGSPLPLPPLTIPRSFSIPSNNQRAMALHVAQLLESPQRKGKGDVMCSPPLTPLSLSNTSNSGQIRVQKVYVQKKNKKCVKIIKFDILSSVIRKMKVVQLAQPFVVPTFCRHLKPRAVSKHNHDSTISLTLKRKAAEISPDLKGTCLFLVGINSSIKSNSAQLLADALRYYYFDSDSVVEQALGGKDAVRSFMKTDLKGFRDSETEVLKQLSSMGRLVVCAGNGAVQCAANLALMRHGISIWIDVPLDMVAKQIVEEKFQLPAAEAINGSYSEVLTQLTAIYEDSRNGYATADTTIALQNTASRLGYDTLDAVTTEDMVLETLKEVERLMRSKKLMEEAARPF